MVQRRTWQLAVLFLAAIAVAAPAQAVAGAQPIPIGLLGPQSGPTAYYGQQQRWGAQMAVDEINGAGGVLGRPLRIVAEDNACNPAQSVSALENLITLHRVRVVLDGLCSSAALAVMPIVERREVPFVAAIPTHPDITRRAGVGGNRWVFRITPSDETMGAALARFLVEQKGIRRFSYVAEDTDYGRGGVESVSRVAEALGASTVSVDYFRKGEQDFTTIVTRLKRLRPEVVITYILDLDQLNFMKQYREVDVGVPISGRPNLSASNLHEVLATGYFDGATTIFPYSPGYDDPANRAFARAFEARFGEPPIYQGFASYLSVKVAAEAIRLAGSDHPAAIRQALERVEVASPMGVVRFDDHHQAHINALVMEWRDGALHVLGVVRT